MHYFTLGSELRQTGSKKLSQVGENLLFEWEVSKFNGLTENGEIYFFMYSRFWWLGLEVGVKGLKVIDFVDECGLNAGDEVNLL